MRPIGGEIELKQKKYVELFTDSGRSSLRLFLRSGNNRKKKILIPDFLCDIIVKVLREEGISYDFYNIDERFLIDNNSIKNKEFDILYIIHYFGNITNIEINLKNKILIEDYVFNYSFKNRLNHEKWYAFNSFRKISPMPDGSHVKTNMDIDLNKIKHEEASFVNLKKLGKYIKYDYIHSNKYNESLYLSNFESGEKYLDNQFDIYTISNLSIACMTEISFAQNQDELKKRYKILEKEFKNHLKLSPIHFSFFILKLNKREMIRKELMKKNIFLPIHWNGNYSKNTLSGKVLSIPLFNNITDKDFLRLKIVLKEVLGKQRVVKN